MLTRNVLIHVYMLVKLSYVQSLIVSGTQSTWSESKKFCADRNDHLTTPESLLAMNRLSGDICDVTIRDNVWIFGVTYQLACDLGKCQNIEVRRLPSDTELDFLCQSNKDTFYATGSDDRPYHLALSGCGPKTQGWPRLANMSTNLPAIKNLIDKNHIKENQLYWVQDFNLNWANKTCKALQRINQSFAQLINIPCDMLAKTACNQGIGHSQKAVRYYLTDGSQDDPIISLSCSEFDIDMITTEPRLIDYFDDDVNYDIIADIESSDGNFSSNRTVNSNNTLVTTDSLRNIKTLYIISGAAGAGVVVLAVIVVVASCCARKQVEVMPYGEPKDMIRTGSHYRYEHPYDTRKNCEKVIKIKALNKDSDNYDYPDVVIDTEKSKVLSNTYDEVIPTNAYDGGNSTRTPERETCEKNVLLQKEHLTSKSSTNTYSYIDVTLGPKFVNTQHFDTDRSISTGEIIENSRKKEENIYL